MIKHPNRLWMICISIIAMTSSMQAQNLKTVVTEALDFSAKQYALMAKEYTDKKDVLPRSFENGKDISSNSRWWCSGFFPGSLWYLYEYNQDPQLLKYAKLYTQRIEKEKNTTSTHDLGFMLYCSFGNGLRLTGENSYTEVLLTGAKSLATRYEPAVGLIRSWDFNKKKWQCPVIIDNMMNLEFMMWASDYSGDPQFKDIAISHANKTMENHFRKDYSSYHVVSYDTITGVPHIKQTHQGYSDESAWSRGQAWALYGYTVMYRTTKDKAYLDLAQNIASYLIEHPRMPKDYIPYWDFDAPNIPNAPRDASAATIMASALLELEDYVDKKTAKKYRAVVEKQIKMLTTSDYTAQLGENGCFILKHSVGSIPNKSEVDVPLSYADYYYIEALMRLKKKL